MEFAALEAEALLARAQCPEVLHGLRDAICTTPATFLCCKLVLQHACMYGGQSPYRPKTILPAGSPPMVMSKNTFLPTSGAAAATCIMITHALGNYRCLWTTDTSSLKSGVWGPVLTTVAKAALPTFASALCVASIPYPTAAERCLAEAVMQGCLEGRNVLHTCDGVCTARTAMGSLLAIAAVAIPEATKYYVS